MATPRCTWEVRTASLATPFGRDFAMRAFGLTEDQLAELVGRISRGPRKGLLRGYIAWGKTLTGGWVKTGAYDWDAGQGNGFVMPPNKVFGHGLYNAQNECLRGFNSLDPRSDVTQALRDALDGRKPATPAQQMEQARQEEAQRPVAHVRDDNRLFISVEAHRSVLREAAGADDYMDAMNRWGAYSGWLPRPH